MTIKQQLLINIQHGNITADINYITRRNIK